MKDETNKNPKFDDDRKPVSIEEFGDAINKIVEAGKPEDSKSN